MFGVCKRYVRNRADAEELLVGAFFKAMTNIGKYGERGSFEGWIRRIVVNECLMHLRQQHNFKNSVELSEVELRTEVTVEADLAHQELVQLLDRLPTGYRTIFNMYVIEGYKHREIAEMLGISIHTSKSQLILAKQKLRDMIVQQQYHEVG